MTEAAWVVLGLLVGFVCTTVGFWCGMRTAARQWVDEQLTMARRRDGWVFTDAQGDRWLLRPTDDPGMPLVITPEQRR